MNGRQRQVFNLLVSLVLIIIVIAIIIHFIIVPTFYAKGLGEISHETIDDPFSRGNAGYLVFKQEFQDWVKCLLPIAGFLLGRLNGRRKG